MWKLRKAQGVDNSTGAIADASRGSTTAPADTAPANDNANTEDVLLLPDAQELEDPVDTAIVTQLDVNTQRLFQLPSPQKSPDLQPVPCRKAILAAKPKRLI